GRRRRGWASAGGSGRRAAGRRHLDRLPDQEQRVRGEAVAGGQRLDREAIRGGYGPEAFAGHHDVGGGRGRGARRRGGGGPSRSQRRGALGFSRDLDRLASVDGRVVREPVVGGDRAGGEVVGGRDRPQGLARQDRVRRGCPRRFGHGHLDRSRDGRDCECCPDFRDRHAPSPLWPVPALLPVKDVMQAVLKSPGPWRSPLSSCRKRVFRLARRGVFRPRPPLAWTLSARREIHKAMEVEIGRGKKGRRAYGFDDIAIVPSRRTRDPDDVDISWTLGPYRFELPLLAAAMDGVVSPATAAEIGRLGGLAVLNLEGIWSRYEDAEEQLERIAGASPQAATATMQEIYREPVKPELIAQR